jgi:lipopolysaccharide/colanic/teichoic acid biosynthesis glycosyltransferase
VDPGQDVFPAPAEVYGQMEAIYGGRRVDTILRALDLAIAASVLTVSTPIVGVVAAAIRLTSGPPVLYRGARVGRGGETFTMYKFRTLSPTAEARLGPYLGQELTRRTDREVTTVGRVLRAVHVDELPQLWNVLRGEMSIVGPRPIRPAFFAELTREIPQYWQRLVVRPGVTGFAQTRMTREETWSDKLAHDLEYIADRSVTLYLQVILATVLRVARRSLASLERLVTGARDERLDRSPL